MYGVISIDVARWHCCSFRHKDDRT